MSRIRLIHWNASEATVKGDQLREAGYDVESALPDGPTVFRELQKEQPAAIVIDLNRLPSQGRDFAVAIRASKSTRQIPIVFVDGDSSKVDKIKELLPDAEYTSWSRIRSSVKRAILSPPVTPIATDSVFAAYAGTPLAKKLGIKADFVVALINAPDGLEDLLGQLPSGVKIRYDARGRSEITLWFVLSTTTLEERIGRMTARADKGGLWIFWPKKASNIESDLTQAVVRKIGLDAGLVDFKISSFDKTWSGLRFTQRKNPRSKT